MCQFCAQILDENKVIVIGRREKTKNTILPPPPTAPPSPPFLGEAQSSSHMRSIHLKVILNTTNCMKITWENAHVAAQRFLWNPQTMPLLGCKGNETGREFKKCGALEIFLSIDVTCFFLCISSEKDARVGNRVASDGSKSLWTMMKT